MQDRLIFLFRKILLKLKVKEILFTIFPLVDKVMDKLMKFVFQETKDSWIDKFMKFIYPCPNRMFFLCLDDVYEQNQKYNQMIKYGNKEERYFAIGGKISVIVYLIIMTLASIAIVGIISYSFYMAMQDFINRHF